MALANVALTDTFDTWRIRTNQLCVLYDQANTSVVNNGLLANLAYGQANVAYSLTNTKIGAITSNSSSRIWANNVTNASNNKLVFLDLATSGVTAGSYGGASAIPVVTVDAYGRITSATTTSVTSMDYPFANSVGVAANAYALSTSTTIGAASNTWANNVGVAANAYALSISGSGSTLTGAACNAWANTVGTSGNSYAIAVGAASNAWSNTVGTAGNNYTNSVGAASNAWANTVSTAGNNYTRTVGASSNAWANTVGTSGNSYAIAVGASSNAWANTVGTAGNNFTSATYVKLAGNQTITGGYIVTPYAQASSNFTVNPALGNYQYISSLTGSVTLTAPASDCAVDIMITNGAGGPTLVLSGFSDTSGNNGDAWNNTSGNKFLFMIRRINSISTYTIKAMQP